MYQIRPGDFSGWTENSVTGYLNERKLTSDIKRVFRYSRKRTCNFAISKTRYTIKRGRKVTIIISDGQKPKVTKTVKLDNISIPYEPAVTGEKAKQ